MENHRHDWQWTGTDRSLDGLEGVTCTCGKRLSMDEIIVALYDRDYDETHWWQWEDTAHPLDDLEGVICPCCGRRMPMDEIITLLGVVSE